MIWAVPARKCIIRDEDRQGITYFGAGNLMIFEISEQLPEDSGHRNDVGVVVLWEEWRSRRRRKMEEKHGQTKMSLARNSIPMSLSLLCVATKIMPEVGNKLQVNAGYGRKFPG